MPTLMHAMPCHAQLALLPRGLCGPAAQFAARPVNTVLSIPPLFCSVEMRDEHRMVYSDEFALSFHMHFYRLLKWLLAAPFVAAAAAILALPAPGADLARLPSLSLSPRATSGGII